MKVRFLLLSLFILSIHSSCIKEKDDTDYPYLEHEIEVGDKVPGFTIYEKINNSGHSFSSREFAGKTSVLMFFNTGCGDCQREMPKIDRICKTLQNDPDYQFIAIARDQEENEVKEYWTKHNYSILTYVDPGRKVYTLFANQTVPRIYLINKESIVKWIAIEEILISEEELLEMICQLNEPS